MDNIKRKKRKEKNYSNEWHKEECLKNSLILQKSKGLFCKGVRFYSLFIYLCIWCFRLMEIDSPSFSFTYEKNQKKKYFDLGINEPSTSQQIVLKSIVSKDEDVILEGSI